MRELAFCAASKRVSATKLPSPERYVVSLASLCQVEAAATSGTKKLTATLESGASLRSTGSLTTGAPGGMVTEGAPPKVSALSVPGTMAPSAAPMARCTAPRVTGAFPYSLERTTRTLLPPTLTRAYWRTVWLRSDGGMDGLAKNVPSQTGCGLAVQVGTQTSSAAAASDGPTARAARSATASRRARRFRGFGGGRMAFPFAEGEERPNLYQGGAPAGAPCWVRFNRFRT